jgi:hypothetical protein
MMDYAPSPWQLPVSASPNDLRRLEPPCLTGPDLATAIRAGNADCGIATGDAAKSAGLDFAPLLWESLDLLMRQRSFLPAGPGADRLLGRRAVQAAGGGDDWLRHRTGRSNPVRRLSNPVRRLIDAPLDLIAQTSHQPETGRPSSGQRTA